MMMIINSENLNEEKKEETEKEIDKRLEVN
jgi:hypothetical protein